MMNIELHLQCLKTKNKKTIKKEFDNLTHLNKFLIETSKKTELRILVLLNCGEKNESEDKKIIKFQSNTK